MEYCESEQEEEEIRVGAQGGGRESPRTAGLPHTNTAKQEQMQHPLRPTENQTKPIQSPHGRLILARDAVGL